MCCHFCGAHAKPLGPADPGKCGFASLGLLLLGSLPSLLLQLMPFGGEALRGSTILLPLLLLLLLEQGHAGKHNPDKRHDLAARL